MGKTVRDWWHQEAYRTGQLRTAGSFFAKIFEFIQESTPHRRRMRYGDVDFDWDHRVNTTSATVSAKSRLLGLFHSPYQPTEPGLFHEMLNAVQALGVNFADYTFIDIGSGKGRTLVMAADYPFRRIIGVELLSELHQVAVENINQRKSVLETSSQGCESIESVHGDACNFRLPDDPLLLYLFNPLPEEALSTLIANLDRSLRDHLRRVYVLYHNPLLEKVLAKSGFIRRVGGTDQYVIYRG